MQHNLEMDLDQVAADLIVTLGPKKLKNSTIMLSNMQMAAAMAAKNVKPKKKKRLDIKFECHSCSKEFTTKQNLSFHIRDKHIEGGAENKKFECSVCDYATNYQSNLSRHLLIHDDTLNSKPFECSTCHQTFAQSYYLMLHVERMHPVIMSSLKSSDVKRFKCAVCQKKFGVELNLKSHIKRLHLIDQNQKPFKCDQCQFSTHYQGALKRHLVVHDRTNAFECEICGKSYTTRPNLIAHVKRLHTKTDDEQTKEYCCIQCDFQTHYKHSFEMHMNGHNGVKLYECPRCKKRFTTKKVQRLHIERDTCSVPPSTGGGNNRKAPSCKPTIKNRKLDRSAIHRKSTRAPTK